MSTIYVALSKLIPTNVQSGGIDFDPNKVKPSTISRDEIRIGGKLINLSKRILSTGPDHVDIGMCRFVDSDGFRASVKQFARMFEGWKKTIEKSEQVRHGLAAIPSYFFPKPPTGQEDKFADYQAKRRAFELGYNTFKDNVENLRGVIKASGGKELNAGKVIDVLFTPPKDVAKQGAYVKNMSLLIDPQLDPTDDGNTIQAAKLNTLLTNLKQWTEKAKTGQYLPELSEKVDHRSMRLMAVVYAKLAKQTGGKCVDETKPPNYTGQALVYYNIAKAYQEFAEALQSSQKSRLVTEARQKFDASNAKFLASTSKNVKARGIVQYALAMMRGEYWSGGKLFYDDNGISGWEKRVAERGAVMCFQKDNKYDADFSSHLDGYHDHIGRLLALTMHSAGMCLVSDLDLQRGGGGHRRIIRTIIKPPPGENRAAEGRNRAAE